MLPWAKECADTGVEAASSDHIPGVLALIEGASQRKISPAYFIHVGGTGMLHEVPNGFGKLPICRRLFNVLIS